MAEPDVLTPPWLRGKKEDAKPDPRPTGAALSGEVVNPTCHIPGLDFDFSDVLEETNRDTIYYFSYRRYRTAQEFWVACKGYCQWAIDHPVIDTRQVTYKGEVKTVEMRRPRVFIMTGLRAYLGLSGSTTHGWCNPDHIDYRADLALVLEHVKAIINEHKLSGVAAGVFHYLVLGGISTDEEYSVQNATPKVTFNLQPITSVTFLPPED